MQQVEWLLNDCSPYFCEESPNWDWCVRRSTVVVKYPSTSMIWVFSFLSIIANVFRLPNKTLINCLTFRNTFMMHHTPINIENDQYHLNVRTNLACFFGSRGKLRYPLRRLSFRFNFTSRNPGFVNRHRVFLNVFFVAGPGWSSWQMAKRCPSVSSSRTSFCCDAMHV